MELPSDQPGEAFGYTPDPLYEFDTLLGELAARHPYIARQEVLLEGLVVNVDEGFAYGVLTRLTDMN